MATHMTRPLVLVAEDEALIGLAIESELEDAGFVIAGPFMTGHAALAFLALEEVAVAIVDAFLQDGPAIPLLVALQAREIPVIVHSGAEAEELPEMQAIRRVSKPAGAGELAAAVQAVIG